MTTVRHTLTIEQILAVEGMHLAEQFLRLFEQVAPQHQYLEFAFRRASTGAQTSPHLDAASRLLVLNDTAHGLILVAVQDPGPAPQTNGEARARVMTALAAATERTGMGPCQLEVVLPPLPETAEPGARTALSARERDVLRELVSGKTDRAIGEQLCLSPGTVRYHLTRIYRKLRVSRRSEAIAVLLGSETTG